MYYYLRQIAACSVVHMEKQPQSARVKENSNFPKEKLCKLCRRTF